MTTEKHLTGFMTELEALTRKYNLSVGGCGCCQSPFLSELKESDMTGKYEYNLASGNGDPFVDGIRWTSKP